MARQENVSPLALGRQPVFIAIKAFAAENAIERAQPPGSAVVVEPVGPVGVVPALVGVVVKAPMAVGRDSPGATRGAKFGYPNFRSAVATAFIPKCRNCAKQFAKSK